MILGTGASPGIALGRVLLIKNEPLRIEKKTITDGETEKKKLLEALEISKMEIQRIQEKVLKELGKEKPAIFDAHKMILDDPELIENTIRRIGQEKMNAEYAFKEVADEFVAIFEAMDNEYMRERAADIRDVSDRVLRNITGQKVIDLSVLEEDIILAVHDLTPSDTATMDKEKVLGFLTNIGGRTSHTAIMARTLEIPAVVGLRDITERVKPGDFVILNGETGEVVINPSEEAVNRYKRLKAAYEEGKRELESIKGKESVTLDGRKVELAGNIGTPQDIAALQRNDAEGVGLFRTEFLYMNRDVLPGEEEQFHAYKRVLEALAPIPVVIRTLDIGGDKHLSYLKIGEEMDPFLDALRETKGNINRKIFEFPVNSKIFLCV